MVNEGSHHYPYQPYNGDIVREKDINGTLLWENGNPTADFAEQTLRNLPDLSKYKYIVIKTRLGTSGTNNYVSKYELLDFSGEDTTLTVATAINGTIYSRVFKLLSSTSLKFMDGKAGSTTSNSVVIPVAIYGTNVL